MPDPLLRANIWKAHIPPSVKVASDVDFNALALKYELTGGFIKSMKMRWWRGEGEEGRGKREEGARVVRKWREMLILMF
jgi:hypothetical protein